MECETSLVYMLVYGLLEELSLVIRQRHIFVLDESLMHLDYLSVGTKDTSRGVWEMREG